jgi:hypothetical protein
MIRGKTMKSQKLETIIESLHKRGMTEGGIRDFLNKIQIAIKTKQLDKLTNDPEYQKIIKQYNIKPVDWTKNYEY